MANDVSSKSSANNSNNNNSENALPSYSDQQKVPPLRIVLNTAGNQKGSSTTTSVTLNNSQQTTVIKRERTGQDAKASNNSLKSGGRVRIKLGTNRQQVNSNKNGSTSEHIGATCAKTDGQRLRGPNEKVEENSRYDTTTTTYSHLRRITRRSQRAVQIVTNEDEESISSMTSVDENQSTNTNANGDNIAADLEQSTSNQAPNSTTSTNSSTNATNGSSNVETPRRYKRRKGETSESQTIENDYLNLQNYKLPIQNSFELFRNIRMQVDKKLKGLNSIHPKTPYGFRDYMLTRGAYLLDGNKLGNGTNLFISEDGGLHPVPVGKYHAFRHGRINYSVPNRAKVPLGLPVNSPLYDLFIEQEKERYRTRMQHIKEREKLTLAAEQEIMRVYNQAALAAANQEEPFSACTMLKHQEIYNYLDSDGLTILSREDAQQDQEKPDGVRTRRRQHHGQISPVPTSRKNSNTEESSCSAQTNEGTRKDSKSPPEVASTAPVNEGSQTSKTELDQDPESKIDAASVTKKCLTDNVEQDKCVAAAKDDGSNELQETKKSIGDDQSKAKQNSDSHDQSEENSEKQIGEAVSDEIIKIEPGENDSKSEQDKTDENKNQSQVDSSKLDGASADAQGNDNSNGKEEALNDTVDDATKSSTEKETKSQESKLEVSMDVDAESVAHVSSVDTGSADKSDKQPSEADRTAQNKEIFLSHLQEIDDKWERIRNEMLIRHRNEAESLHAVQKLEWEWKTKEIGACDVRTTPVIDGTLVPKLNIYSQDY